MRKYNSFLLLAVLLTFMMSKMLVLAETKFDVICTQNFNTLAAVPDTVIDSGGTSTLSLNSTSFADDAFYQEFLKLSGTKSGYAQLTAAFGEIKAEGADKYAEISFDLYTSGLRNAGSNITIRVNSKIKTLFLSGGGNMYIGENSAGTKLASTAKLDSGDWVNYKLVFQLTDSVGSKTGKIIGVYENGVNVMEDIECPFDTSDTMLKSISIQLSKKEGDYWLGLDNFMVASYTSAEGVSPVPDKAELVRASKQVEAAMLDAEQYTEGEIAELEKLQKYALELFYRDSVTRAEIREVREAMEFVLARNAVAFTGISVRKEDGTSVGFITGGILEKVIVEKRRDIQSKLSVIAAVYDKNGVLEQCGIGILDTSTDFGDHETAEIPFSLRFSENIRKKKVKLFLWDGGGRPIFGGFDSGLTHGQEYELTVNGTKPTMAVKPFIGENGELYLPAKQIINLLGMSCEERNGIYTAKSDYGTVLTFSETEGSCNGTLYSAAVKSGIIMLPMSAFSDAFGAQATVDEFTAKVEFSAEIAVKEYSSSPEGLVSYTGSAHSVHYQIRAGANAKVEVWYRRGYQGSYLGIAWNRAQEPVYRNGVWTGGIAGVPVDTYHFRIRITENGDVNTYEDYHAIRCGGTGSPTLAAMVGTTNGELVLDATYENIGYTIDAGTASGCEVTYREKGKSWAMAYAPANDGLQFRGSIVGLKPGTEYEVKAVLSDAVGATVSTKTAAVLTQSEEPAVAETILLSDIYKSGGLLLSGYHGNPNGWIRIINDDNTVIDGESTYTEAVLVEDCSYLILDGFTVRGGYRHGINISDNASYIRIINCDVSGWGRPGVLDDTRGRYVYDGTDINFDAGVCLLNADHVTVERCYIHGSAAQTNSWTTANWQNVHPQGACGIYYSSRDSVVIRYNDIVGNYNHLFNDGIEGYNNGSRMGGASRNCDIYGNMIYLGEDDGMELDGAQMNARVYKNRIERFYCGVSLAPNLTGPSYLFRNQIVNLGTTYQDRVYTGLKIGGSTDGIFGMHYLFHNTVDSNASGVTNSNYNDTTEFHSVSANNIFVTRKNGSNDYGFRNIYADARDINDYDLVGGKYVIGQSGTTPIDGTTVAKNSLKGYPIYVNADRGNYRLAVSSPGVGSGTYLDNFCEEVKPNMGVYSKNDITSFMPYRPVDMQADSYRLTLSDGRARTVTVTFGEAIEGECFKILSDNAWISTNLSGGTVTPGKTVSFTIKADFSKSGTSAAYGDEKYGMVLVRLNNGYSIPISITLNK